ncbi:MAG: PilZ domain-containing protein [Gammaproteobacteria bacterium]|nr:PilZ domain-containing protein [Gammaproteobacteria bacterium]
MSELNHRAYIRHPADIPIEIALMARDRKHRQRVRDISFGGLRCGFSAYVKPGTLIRLNIRLVDPPFDARARVIWCHSCVSGFDLGVEFMDAEDAFRARMVEQVCHIEQYRRWAKDSEGRELNAEEAAREWISRYAADFPDPPDRGE